VVFGTVDRIVGRNVQVIQIGRDRISFRNISKVFILGRGEHLHFAEIFGFLDRFFGPYAGVHVSGLLFEEIVRHFEKLRAGAAAQKEDLIVVGNIQQFAEQGHGFVVDSLEVFGTVRNLQQRQSGTLKIQNSFCRILNRHARKNRRTCIEIVFFHSFKTY